MNYLKIYCNLIRKAEQRGYTKKKAKEQGLYVEGHHTFPVSIFGKNKRIVCLTAREHYIAHALLEKVCIKRYGLYHKKTIKMNFAHNAMKCKNIYTNSYLYEKSKIRRIQIIKETGVFDGEKNPFYGKTHSEKSKAKMRESRKNLGAEFFTECGRKGSQTCKEKGIGLFSQTKEDLQKIAKRNQELNIGIFSLTYEQRVENGKIWGSIGGTICKKLGKGMFALSPEEKKKNAIKNGKKGGEKTKENGTGIFSLTKEQRTEYGKKTKQLGLGIFAITKEEKKEISRKAGNKVKELGIGVCGLTTEQRQKYGKEGGGIGGKVSYEMKKGIHGMSEEERRQASIKGGQSAGRKTKENGTGIFSLTKEQRSEIGKKVNKQKWKCTETGYISTAAGLTNYQIKRNIDRTKRIKINFDELF